MTATCITVLGTTSGAGKSWPTQQDVVHQVEIERPFPFANRAVGIANEQDEAACMAYLACENPIQYGSLQS